MGIVSTLPLQQREEDKNGTQMLWATGKESFTLKWRAEMGLLEIQSWRQLNTRVETWPQQSSRGEKAFLMFTSLLLLSLLLNCSFPLLEAVPSLATLLQELLFFSTFSFQNSVLFLCKTYTSSKLFMPSMPLCSSFCLLRLLTAMTHGTSRCPGKREHEQKQHLMC